MSKSVNLITPQTLSGFAVRKSKRIWKRFTVAAFVACVVTTCWLAALTSDTNQRIASEVDNGNGPRKVLAKHKQLQQELAKLSRVEGEQVRLRSSHSPVSLFALLSDIKQQLDGELVVERVDYALDKLPSAKSASAPPAAAQANGKVTLQLVTTSTIKSSSVIEKLSHCGFFTEVQLSTALVKADAQTEDLRFSVACQF